MAEPPEQRLLLEADLSRSLAVARGLVASRGVIAEERQPVGPKAFLQISRSAHTPGSKVEAIIVIKKTTHNELHKAFPGLDADGLVEFAHRCFGVASIPLSNGALQEPFTRPDRKRERQPRSSYTVLPSRLRPRNV